MGLISNRWLFCLALYLIYSLILTLSSLFPFAFSCSNPGKIRKGQAVLWINFSPWWSQSQFFSFYLPPSSICWNLSELCFFVIHSFIHWVLWENSFNAHHLALCRGNCPKGTLEYAVHSAGQRWHSYRNSVSCYCKDSFLSPRSYAYILLFYNHQAKIPLLFRRNVRICLHKEYKNPKRCLDIHGLKRMNPITVHVFYPLAPVVPMNPHLHTR